MSGGTRTRRRPAVSDHDKLRRRDEMMAAAKKVFARNDFHATAIADVVEFIGNGLRPRRSTEGEP